MAAYRSSECNKPDNKKLVWIVSRRTAQNLQANHFSVPGLPTIPERSWDESERLIVHFSTFFMFDFVSNQLNLPCCEGEILTECFLRCAGLLKLLTKAIFNLHFGENQVGIFSTASSDAFTLLEMLLVV